MHGAGRRRELKEGCCYCLEQGAGEGHFNRSSGTVHLGGFILHQLALTRYYNY